MKVENIKALLTAFYEGKATEEEEKILKEYFAKEDVPDFLLNEQKIFKALSPSPNRLKVPRHLETKLGILIDKKAEEEKIFLPRNKSKINWMRVGGIAACLFIMFFVGYKVDDYYMNKTPQDTYTNPQEAYKAMQTALAEVSTNMNKGFKELKENKKEISRVNQEVIKEIK